MKAQVVKINPKTVVIKSEKGTFATVAKTKLDFDYKLGDVIILEKNGDEVYFLPNSAAGFSSSDDFWGDAPVAREIKRGGGKEYDNSALTGSVIILVLAAVGWFIAFYACFGGAIAALFYSFSHAKDMDPEKKPIMDVLLVFGIMVWVAEIAIASGYGM